MKFKQYTNTKKFFIERLTNTHGISKGAEVSDMIAEYGVSKLRETN